MEFELNSKNNNHFVVLTLVLCAGVATAPATFAADAFSAVATAGLTHSGDAWAVARTRAGQVVAIDGGGRMEVGAGGIWHPAGYPVAASALLNYNAGNSATGKFSRVPLDGFIYYTGLEQLRFGLGVSYIMAPQATVTVDGERQTVKFKNTTGRAFEAGYRIAPGLWANLRLSSERYRPKDAGSGAARHAMSHLSVNLSYQF